jgi:hypothetical protein
MRQLGPAVPFYFGPSAKGPSIATTDGGAIVVEIDEGRKPSFLTGIEPINDYSDRVETALGVKHWFHLLAPNTFAGSTERSLQNANKAGVARKRAANTSVLTDDLVSIDVGASGMLWSRSMSCGST